MLNKFLKSLIVIFALVISSTSELSLAREIPESEVETLLLRMQSVLNRKNKNEMNRFFKFYTEDSARFLMKNHLVDPNNTNEVLATEELNMTWEQYVTYLNNIIEPNYVYLFKIKLTEFEFDQATELATASFNMQEYALQRQFGENRQKLDDITTLGATNCNLSIGENATDLEILSMNCISKVVRK